ncbi:hypothetical protein SAMN04488034_101193 [Salinimicrobium catena]|uniref:Uncharacterized protein n=1 Tax=Salinimicrobium catena TaxID=390640 RepID=A0A1H5HLJ8_9FLAO|nr:hypothetical protein [Salinimicrobium catena]SDK71106.1 hypothetical protein SAMN04488140_101193 [Salinimicrobium catena]SEE28892.1 hypothetical protein SAMN04488034_101193 [Salinimicrobium catena]
MTLHKILKYLALVIGVIGLILWGRVLMAGDEAIESSASVQASVVTPFLYVAYFIFALIVLLVAVYVIKGLFAGDIKKTLLSVGVFILIVVVAYLVSGGTEMTMTDGEVISANTVHWVGAGLITFYILAITAILLMVISGVKKLIK